MIQVTVIDSEFVRVQLCQIIIYFAKKKMIDIIISNKKNLKKIRKKETKENAKQKPNKFTRILYVHRTLIGKMLRCL